MDGELTALESEVLRLVLMSVPDLAEPLRLQVEAARVTARTPSGVGFVTKLDVPGELSLSDRLADISLPSVYGDHSGLPSGAEFVLQLKHGRLNSIEAFCYEGMWPSDESIFGLTVKR